MISYGISKNKISIATTILFFKMFPHVLFYFPMLQVLGITKINK
jgi:hypothetical protein